MPNTGSYRHTNRSRCPYTHFYIISIGGTILSIAGYMEKIRNEIISRSRGGDGVLRPDIHSTAYVSISRQEMVEPHSNAR